jgi:hypothetical protein
VSIVTRDGSGVVVDSQQIDVNEMLDGAQRWSETSFVSLDVHAGEPTPISVLSTAFEPSQIFVTQDSAYLLGSGYELENQRPITEIEKFIFDETGLGAKSVAVGSVVGSLLNQFSAGEHEGRLQIATNSWTVDGLENRVTVLEEQAGRLTVVGELTGIAPGEQIYAARFYDDRAFVVTFRRVDPLFVLDMSDPTEPTVVGELKIPGYSQYLQLLGPDLLLGIGRDADPETGAFDGLQVSLFDLTDPSAPVLRDQHEFAGGRETFSPLADAWNLSDHHAVSFFDSHDILALPIFQSAFQPWFNWRIPLVIDGNVVNPGPEEFSSSVQVLRVNDEVGIELVGEVPFADSQAIRSLRIGEHLFAISRTELKVTEIDNPKTVLGTVYIGGGATDNTVIARAGRPIRLDLIGNDALLPSSVINNVDIGQAPVEIIEEGQAVLYTPPLEFVGEDQFIYSVTGMAGHREAATTRIEVLWNWHNVQSPNDVNRDGHTTPQDALRLINLLNSHGNLTIEQCDAFDEVFQSFHPDVNDDGQVAPLDLLVVINELNRAAELRRAPTPEPEVYEIPFWLENDEE